MGYGEHPNLVKAYHLVTWGTTDAWPGVRPLQQLCSCWPGYILCSQCCTIALLLLGQAWTAAVVLQRPGCCWITAMQVIKAQLRAVAAAIMCTLSTNGRGRYGSPRTSQPRQRCKHTWNFGVRVWSG